MTTYQIGDAPILTITCKTAAVVIADPTGLQVQYQQPATSAAAATTTTYVYGVDAAVTKTTTGVYAFACPVITRAGRHEVKPTATGTNAASEQTFFLVDASNITAPEAP